MTMGEKIAQARKAKRMSQEQLAEKLGVSFQAVSSWERDENLPDTARLKPLTDALGVTADSLLAPGDRGWTTRDRFFDEEHMYTYLKAQAAGLSQTVAALAFARAKHEGQFRKGPVPVPYVSHPLTMCCHAWAMGIRDDDALAAILLHDVVEDTGTPLEDLPVGSRAREAVRLVSYNTYFDREKETQDEAKKHIKPDYYAAIAKDPLACLVKCVDRCHNVSCMFDGFDHDKQATYVRETERYVMPLLEVIKAVPAYNNAAWLLRYQLTALLETYKRML